MSCLFKIMLFTTQLQPPQNFAPTPSEPGSFASLSAFSRSTSRLRPRCGTHWSDGRQGTRHPPKSPMLGVSKNRGKPPKWMVYFMENPINPWMIWGENPIFWKQPCFFDRKMMEQWKEKWRTCVILMFFFLKYSIIWISLTYCESLELGDMSETEPEDTCTLHCCANNSSAKWAHSLSCGIVKDYLGWTSDYTNHGEMQSLKPVYSQFNQ